MKCEIYIESHPAAHFSARCGGGIYFFLYFSNTFLMGNVLYREKERDLHFPRASCTHHLSVVVLLPVVPKVSRTIRTEHLHLKVQIVPDHTGRHFFFIEIANILQIISSQFFYIVLRTKCIFYAAEKFSKIGK